MMYIYGPTQVLMRRRLHMLKFLELKYLFLIQFLLKILDKIENKIMIYLKIYKIKILSFFFFEFKLFIIFYRLKFSNFKN